jgi:glycosyltransferase involved in cell wall biosynthesis
VSPPGADARPACLVTGAVTDYRVEPFRRLAELERVEVLAWADSGPPAEGLRVRRTTQRGAARLAASGRYRAVIGGLGGRVALPGSYLGARLAGVPFVLWASLWAHPRTPAHVLSYAPMLALYRGADAVATYGPHVSRYVRARRGRRGSVVEAPQAVDPRVFGAPVAPERRAAARGRAGAGRAGFLLLFVGRLVPEKGVRVLLEAWRRAGLGAAGALALVGDGPLAGELAGAGVGALGALPRAELPALYAAADALVLPSLATATFLEPWGLVVNEAMHQATPIIASDAVGAVAGGLVRDGRNGLVVPAGDPAALAARIRALAGDAVLRRSLGAAARADVAVHTPDAWAEGMSRALAAAGASVRA